MVLTEKKRIYSFDLLKIFSILIVFIYHIVMDMYQIHPMHNMKMFYDIIIRPNMHLAMVACGLFILISGATITYNIREEKPLEFYKRRLIRVLLPFYIAYIIYFIIKVITLKSIHIFGEIEKWRFIYTILGIDEYLNATGIRTFSLGVGEWFLGCIILCYLVYPFLYKAHKKYKIVTFIVMTIYFILINFFYERLNTNMPSHFNFLCQVYNFYFGIFAVDFMAKSNENVAHTVKDSNVGTNESADHTVCDKNVEAKFRSIRRGKQCDSSMLLILTISTFLFFYFFKPIINVPDNFKTTIVAVAIFVSFYLFEDVLAKNSLLTKLISIFSGISYEFFLTHHFVIYQVDYMLNYRRLGGAMTVLVIAIDFVITILMAVLVKNISSKTINTIIHK